jgi:hypothetical protein
VSNVENTQLLVQAVLEPQLRALRQWGLAMQKIDNILICVHLLIWCAWESRACDCTACLLSSGLIWPRVAPHVQWLTFKPALSSVGHSLRRPSVQGRPHPCLPQAAGRILFDSPEVK